MPWPSVSRGEGLIPWSQLSAVSCEAATGAQLWFPPPALLFAMTILSSAAGVKKSS